MLRFTAKTRQNAPVGLGLGLRKVLPGRVELGVVDIQVVHDEMSKEMLLFSGVGWLLPMQQKRERVPFAFAFR